MSKILHHNDDDGRCAAYIVKAYLINPMEVISPKDFIEYNYNSDLTKRYPELVENETVYIVDISMCEAVLDFVQHVIASGGNVIHIDHHATGIAYYNDHKDEIDHNHYTPFMKAGISGAMLTWIYADIFNDEGRKNPNEVKFDFDDDNLRNRCCLVDENGNPIDKEGNSIVVERNITPVPTVLRFIDDNDIWKQKIVETKPFVWGFKLTENKHPLSQIWVELFDESDARSQAQFINNIINNGTVILNYCAAVNARNLASGFYVVINGNYVACVNSIDGNSMIFQDMYDASPAVCKFAFDGEKWWYTFYSKDNGGADCAAIVEWLSREYGDTCGALSHGGHIHAAGATFKKNVFDHLQIFKQEFLDKRKQIRIDKEVAAEQRRIDEEQRRIQAQQEKLAAIRAKIEAREADLEEDDFEYDF